MPDHLVVAILAAGASRRLGRPKQLVELDGEPLIRRQCRTALEAAIGRVLVVLGCHHQSVAAAICDLEVELIVHDEWQEGLAASVRAATRAAMAAGATGLLLYHCDQYKITTEDLIHLHQAWTSSPATAHLSADGDHVGPPAILPARLFSSMLALKGDKGPRAILHGDPQVREIPMPGAGMDIDCPQDLKALRR